MKTQLRDRITVVKDGEEIEVYNWVNIKQPAIVRGNNPVVETFDCDIGAGDSTMKPDAITEWVAEELWHEFSISESDLREKGIGVIDVESEEVDLV